MGVEPIDKFIGVTYPEKYVIFETPENAEVAEFIRKSWRRYVIVIFARSRATYEGRAASKLAWDDHLIILKPDGTLLIHGPAKREPINWQPPGCILTSYIEDGNLIIRSRRFRPKETVIIECEEVYVLLAMSTKKGLFKMLRTESHMVEYVIRNPSMIEEGFVPVAKEYPTKYGFIDLLGRDKEGNIVICEFKRRMADVQHVAQLALYVETFPRAKGVKVRGILIAPQFSEKALLALKEKGLEYRVLDPRRVSKNSG